MRPLLQASLAAILEWPQRRNGVTLYTGIHGHFPSLSTQARAGAREAWEGWRA